MQLRDASDGLPEEFDGPGLPDADDTDSLSGSINPAFLKLAMELRGVATFRELEQRSGVGYSTLRNWDKGRVDHPELENLRAVAAALDVPISLLTRRGRVPAVAAHTFRSLARELSMERTQFVAYSTLLAVFAAFLLGDRWGQRRSPDPLAVQPNAQSPASAALEARRILGLTLTVPAPNMVALAETLGVLVAYGPDVSEQLDSHSAVLGTRRMITINSRTDSYWRQRWDIAHEFGHFVLGHDRSSPSREKAAHDFARAFLYPPTNANMSRLRSAVADSTLEPVLNIQEEWGISANALLRRASTLNYRGVAEQFVLLEAHEASSTPRALEDRKSVV